LAIGGTLKLRHYIPLKIELNNNTTLVETRQLSLVFACVYLEFKN
jgi:hypothetical protein